MILGTSKFCFIFIIYLDAPDFTANPKKATAAEVPTKPYERNRVRTMLRLRRNTIFSSRQTLNRRLNKNKKQGIKQKLL